MAFEIFLTRTIVPGIERRISDDPPLTRADFELVMDGAPIRKRLNDGSCWLWHPENMAWLTASWKEGKETNGGYISLAVSYGHNKFLKVWADAFALALRLARSLNARIFEDSKFIEISRDNIEELLAPHSPLVTEQAEFWKKTVAGMDAHMQAPLEFPVGPYDAVNDYFVFFLDPKKKINMVDLINKLNLYIDPDSLSEDRFAIQDRKTNNLLSRVLLRPNDQALQIWPFYWMEPFSRVAAETLAMAISLQQELGGSLFLKEKALTPALQEEVIEHINGLGVEFFLWLNEHN